MVRALIIGCLLVGACTEPDAIGTGEEHYREFFRIDCTLADNCGLLPAGTSIAACIDASTAQACNDNPQACAATLTLDGDTWGDCRDELAARLCEQVASGTVPSICYNLQDLFFL